MLPHIMCGVNASLSVLPLTSRFRDRRYCQKINRHAGGDSHSKYQRVTAGWPCAARRIGIGRTEIFGAPARSAFQGIAVTVIDFTAFIGRLATASGETILPFFRTSLLIDDKSANHDFDPVTEADRAAEAVMRRLIKANFPQHGIVGEEFGNEREDADYVWVLDPIDGTKSFIAGFPIWGTLIALLHKGTPVFGMMHQPYIGERFSGDNGSAHYHGHGAERRLTVRRCGSLKEATSYTTSPLLMNAADRAPFGRVEAAGRLTRSGGHC